MPHVMLVSGPENDRSFEPRLEENLGILYLEASLEKAGYDCSIIDGLAYNLNYEEILKEILTCNPSLFLGFSIFSHELNNIINMIKDLRKKDFTQHIIIGGMWASHKYREILEEVKEVDSICVGEGEELVAELAYALDAGMKLCHIEGLATRNEDGTINFIPRKFRDNIDSFSVPDRRGYYFDLIKNKKAISLLFTRGCHEKCTFCSIASYIKLCGGPRWRPRSPAAVADEIEFLMRTTGIKKFDFVDDNFLGPSEIEREKCFHLSEEIIKRKLDIRFSVTSRVDGVNYELFETLKKAGLVEITLGIESWSDTQLKRYNKKVKREEIIRAIDILDGLGIDYKCFLLPLDPYVTREEIMDNLDMMEKHRPQDHVIIYSHFWRKIRLDPYLPLFRKCLRDNLIIDFQEKSCDDYNIKYKQFYHDVTGIVEAADTIWSLYLDILMKLSVTGQMKKMPLYQWYRIEKDILNTLKYQFYKYFRLYIGSGAIDGGRDFICGKMYKTCENIMTFAEEIKRDDIMELKEYFLDIDGIKISTRPEGFDELISSIMEKK